uniref:Uncharacterized protein n=1 Tax=Lotharella oceanica TaxID=641309 RepID=A0A7S2TLZ4_9EUKA|mmetsp:Transcript_20370/g.38341  ORF Transcript_20370/g.38341 Transcript_20370/m.38341 type:complete len:156 (+) Transcript_20370:437-904(+)
MFDVTLDAAKATGGQAPLWPSQQFGLAIRHLVEIAGADEKRRMARELALQPTLAPTTLKLWRTGVFPTITQPSHLKHCLREFANNGAFFTKILLLGLRAQLAALSLQRAGWLRVMSRHVPELSLYYGSGNLESFVERLQYMHRRAGACLCADSSS